GTLGQRGGRTDLKKGWAGRPNEPRPAGLALSFAGSCSSFSPSLPESSRVYVFHDCTPIRRRYLRDFFEKKDRMKNPSLNVSLLCLAPKYLDLILWALSFGLHWRVD